MAQKENIFDAAKTRDGFQNLAMKLGIMAPGDEGSEGGNLISKGHYQFNLLTRNRIQLEAAYRGSWIVGRVIDCVAEDMTKSGIILNTSEGAHLIQDLKVQFSRLQIFQSLADTIRWGRLYGGAIGVFQIKGQDLETPLDPETIDKGQFLGLAVYDRWQLNPVLTRVINEGPDIGLPNYYDIVLGSNLNNPGQVLGQGSETVAPISTQANENTLTHQGVQQAGQMTNQTAGANGYGRVRVHHSRCFRMGGHKLPFFQAITEMMWDESVIERMWDRLIEFETATGATGGLIGRALLRTVGIDKLREVLAAGGEAKEGLLQMFEYMRMFQTSEGITLLDKEDNFQTTAYSFAGLSDILERFGEQLSGASETPLVRLFGQTPGGLNSNGDADIRNYYDSINAKQESKLRNPIELLIKIMWRSMTGNPIPSDLTFKFMPLWQMSDKEKAEIAASKTTAIISAHQEGLVKTSTAMKELKEASSDTGVFSHITDEEVDEAEMEGPPLAELESGEEAPIDPVTGEQTLGTESNETQEDTALNGAQVASLVDIVKSVAANELPRDAAIQIIAHSFQLSPNEANRVLGTAGKGFKISKEDYSEEESNEEESNDENPNPSPGEMGEGPRTPEEKIKSKDSIWRKLFVKKKMKDKAPVNDPGIPGTMKEFYAGTLKSSSGKKVTSKKQALAIGYSEEGRDRQMSKDQKAIHDFLGKK